MRHDLRACPKGRPLAVTDGGQPGALGGLADVGTLRQRARVIGRMASHARCRQRQAERIEHRQSDLPLRQIGAMILALSKLTQPFGCPVGRSRRGVDAHHAARHSIDTQHGLVECAFQRSPACRDVEGVEDRRQPGIGQITRCPRVAEAPPEGALVGGALRLDAIASVVALGQDKGQPHDRRPPQAPSLPMAMGWEVVVQ